MSKNELCDLSQAQKDPYRVTGDDFSYQGSVKPGMAEGKNALVPLSEHQESPRLANGAGGDADSMGANSSAVASFKISMNRGEGGEGSQASKISNSASVDLKDGQVRVSGSDYAPSVHNTEDMNVKIGAKSL